MPSTLRGGRASSSVTVRWPPRLSSASAMSAGADRGVARIEVQPRPGCGSVSGPRTPAGPGGLPGLGSKGTRLGAGVPFEDEGGSRLGDPGREFADPGSVGGSVGDADLRRGRQLAPPMTRGKAWPITANSLRSPKPPLVGDGPPHPTPAGARWRCSPPAPGRRSAHLHVPR